MPKALRSLAIISIIKLNHVKVDIPSRGNGVGILRSFWFIGQIPTSMHHKSGIIVRELVAAVPIINLARKIVYV